MSALSVGGVVAVITAVQLRSGVLQLLDTASYQSGAQALGDGHPFTSTLAPSFSNFSVTEFLERDGRLPFVDFPVGYPLISGLLGTVLGARRALGAVVLLATIAFAVTVVWGPVRAKSSSGHLLRAVIALGLVIMPTYRLVVQGGLSEPLFIAAVTGYAVALIRYRTGDSHFRLAIGLGASLGLLRFIGAPLALLLPFEHWRRHRDLPRAVGLAAICVGPAAINVLWASAVGGGHSATWHGIQTLDINLFLRSISGWVDARYGDLAATLLRVGDVIPWFGYPLGGIWLGAVGWSAVSYLRPQTPHAAPIELAVPLTLAGMLTAALFLGLATFDALATPDNRITLPIGMLTIVGVAWWSSQRVGSTGRGPAGFAQWLTIGLALVWVVVAARPTRVGDSFASADPLAIAATVEALDAKIVISNAADNVAWYTGLPSAYLPPERMSLTGELVDRPAIFAALPCALSTHGGVVVVFEAAFFGVDPAMRESLDALVASGALVATATDQVTVLRPAAELVCAE